MICALCDARCCKKYIITVTAMDVVRISKNLNIPAESFAEFYEGEIENQDPATVVRYRGGAGRGVLTLKSQPCVFLNGNRCSIYEFAPLTCKLYPKTVYGKIAGICPPHAKVFFAMKNDNHLIQHVIKEDTAYKKIVRQCNALGLRKHNAFKFLIEKAEEWLKRRGNYQTSPS